MILDLNDLRIFSAVADEASISKAAEKLNYVQSNVTTRIRQLEDRLGVSLFNRQSRGVSLTVPGRQLQEYAIRILALASEAERAVQEQGVPAGTLSIGAMETTAAIRLPELLASYHNAYPNVELQVVTGTSEELLARVIGYKLDTALVAGAVEHPELESEQVFQEELVLAVPSGTELDTLRKRTVLVFRRGCSYRARLEQWLRDEGLVPFQVMEFGTVEGIIGCVRAGMGIALLPRGVFRNETGLELRPLPTSVAQVATRLVWRRDAAVSKALQEFRNLVLAAGKETDSGAR